MLEMLTNEEHQAMIMFDRLLVAAKDNETIADLLDQTLNVARMIDPRPDDKVVYGPLQRMHFEWQQLKHRMGEIEKKMDNYINNQNRYGGSTYTGLTGYPTMHTGSTWPSNPGLDNTTGSFQDGFSTTPPLGSIRPLTITEINNLNLNNQSSSYDATQAEEDLKRLTEQIMKISQMAKSTGDNN